MELALSLAFGFIAWAIIYALTSSFTFRRSNNLPPGPYPIPVIGNILQLGKNPNQSLAKLSRIYGPLMSLKLGSRIAIVVSSPAMAREILQRNDQIFSSRAVPDAAHVHDHHKFSMAWLPASTKWRILRKVSREQLFSVQRLDASQGIRQEKLEELGQYLRICATKSQVVKIGETAFTTALNMMSSTLFSVNYATFGSKSSQEHKHFVCGIMEILGTPNFADYFPLLRYVDPQGIFKKSTFFHGKVFESFDEIIKQRLQERSSSETSSKKQDLLEGLLDHLAKDGTEFTIQDMKNLFLDLIVGGADTTSATVEWGMTELLRNPDKMAKAKAELEEVIGEKKTIEESDISRLSYLQALVKEILRLHPPGPLLIPHKAEANVEINGYLVPKDSQILINVWALGRDSNVWSNAEMFVPERFLQSDIDVRGQHFEFIPFGSGRRICPGLPLAYRMLHLLLAFLIHNFDWKLEEGTEPGDIDRDEHFGLSIQRAVPLKAIPVEV